MAGQGSITLDESTVKNRHVAPTAAIDRSKMAQRALASTGILPNWWRTWDALGTNRPGTPATDDLGIVTGTLGTNPGPYIGTGDLKNAGSTTRYAAVFIALPTDYESAETVMLRAYAGMITTVASVAATVDFEVYAILKDGTVSADLCGTAAQSINSLTADDKDFTITATALAPGTVLEIRMAVLVNDSGTGTAVIGAVYQTELLADLR